MAKFMGVSPDEMPLQDDSDDEDDVPPGQQPQGPERGA